MEDQSKPARLATKAVQVTLNPQIVYLGAFLIGAGLHWWRPWPLFAGRWTGHLVGWPLVVAAGILVLWAERTLKSAGVDPAFEPVDQVVTTGPFAFSRNPMYLGTTLIYAGFGLIVNTVWVFVLLPAVLAFMHYGVIKREEQYLAAQFGDEYHQYCERVGCWLMRI